MFLSVKERARQIANGQFQPAQIPTSDPVAPPPATPKAVSSKIVTAKFTPSKVARSKTAPLPTTPSKTSSSKTPKTPRPKIESPKLAAIKVSTPKTTATKSASSKTSSTKLSPSKPSSSKTSSSKVSPLKLAPTKTASTKVTPSKPVRPKLLSDIGIGSFAEDPAEDDTKISDLKTACLRQVSGVTGLGGKNLAIVLKKSSSSGEWYAALKDMNSDKYLKMWMNRSKTFPTQIEALEAYLVFAKKLKASCRLFPMSPKPSKSKP